MKKKNQLYLVEGDFLLGVGVFGELSFALVNLGFQMIQPVIQRVQIAVEFVAELQRPFKRFPGDGHLLSQL